MSRVFHRTWKVTAYTPSIQQGSWFQAAPNGIEITDLRVTFQVEKNLTKHPNTCHLSVFNCSDRTRGFLEQKPLIVRLEAGYDDVLRHLFQGDVRYADSEIDRTTWNTKIQLADGDRAFRFARVNRSYAAGTPVLTALKAAAASMSLQLPPNVLKDSELSAATTIAGLSLSGPARDEMTRILAAFGYDWSIQNGRLQILREDDLLDGTAFLISENEGVGILKGSPKFATPDKSKKPPHLTVRTTLAPQIEPGAKIEVRARTIKGFFRVDKIRHTGDSHSRADDWTSHIEATPQ